MFFCFCFLNRLLSRGLPFCHFLFVSPSLSKDSGHTEYLPTCGEGQKGVWNSEPCTHRSWRRENGEGARAFRVEGALAGAEESFALQQVAEAWLCFPSMLDHWPVTSSLTPFLSKGRPLANKIGCLERKSP